ncbi:hypothetical protein D9M70_570620 [compost metagenome]
MPVYWSQTPRSRARSSIAWINSGVVVATPNLRPPCEASIIEASQMPITGIARRRLRAARPGSPKALTTIPRHPASCLSPISTTSAAAASNCSGVTIIGGFRMAVATATAMRPDAARRAMETIMSLVASELFGLIRRICALTFSVPRRL